jgi:uncharacterized protein YbbC (DUF1343 family)
MGPQHGLWGQTQDNMIEWESFRDHRTGLQVFSLYGKTRRPSAEILKDLDLLLIDLQDVGARYYTFIWTMALAFEGCIENDSAVMVLDRINPISGNHVEGTFLHHKYSSFVGLLPLATRHGMTIGELARYFKEEFYPELNLEVVTMEGWQRKMYFPDTGFPWVMPSPNITSWETTLVYPGLCLLEGTNISEGRGTNRPFEIFGAPWIDGWNICNRLNQLELSGVYFRPIQFLPTFHKYRNEICEGAFIHVRDIELFKPVLTGVAIIHDIVRHYPDHFRWKNPPYEYEYQKMPIDILAGNSWLREMIDQHKPLNEIGERMNSESQEFNELRKNYLIYD